MVTVQSESITIDFTEKIERIKQLIGNKMLKDIQDNFDKEQSPEGNKWKALTYRTGKILNRTGAFRNSIRMQIDGDTIKVGTNHTVNGVLIPAVHQFGATIHPKTKPYLVFRIGNKLVRAKQVTIPARKWLGMSQSMLNDYIKIAENELTK